MVRRKCRNFTDQESEEIKCKSEEALSRNEEERAAKALQSVQKKVRTSSGK